MPSVAGNSGLRGVGPEPPAQSSGRPLGRLFQARACGLARWRPGKLDHLSNQPSGAAGAGPPRGWRKRAGQPVHVPAASPRPEVGGGCHRTLPRGNWRLQGPGKNAPMVDGRAGACAGLPAPKPKPGPAPDGVHHTRRRPEPGWSARHDAFGQEWVQGLVGKSQAHSELGRGGVLWAAELGREGRAPASQLLERASSLPSKAMHIKTTRTGKPESSVPGEGG